MNIEGIDIFIGNRSSLRIAKVAREISMNGFSRSQPFSIGRVGADVERFAQKNGIVLASKSIYFSAKFYSHAMRDSKPNKVDMSDMISFPTKKSAMDKYYDGDAFIFTDYKTKYIIHPNYKLKMRNGKKRVVNMITAGKVTDANEFKNARYKKI